MVKEYFIPHNYDNSGRVFNLFFKEDVKNALIIGVPLSIIIYNLPLSLQNRLFAFIIIVMPVALIFLSGLGNWFIYLFKFLLNKKVYYRASKEALDSVEFYYKAYTSPKKADKDQK